MHAASSSFWKIYFRMKCTQKLKLPKNSSLCLDKQWVWLGNLKLLPPHCLLFLQYPLHLLAQLNPLVDRLKPASHEQEYDPTLLMQFCSHKLVLAMHSSTSGGGGGGGGGIIDDKDSQLSSTHLMTCSCKLHSMYAAVLLGHSHFL